MKFRLTEAWFTGWGCEVPVFAHPLSTARLATAPHHLDRVAEFDAAEAELAAVLAAGDFR